jgi:hypothetical protein
LNFPAQKNSNAKWSLFYQNEFYYQEGVGAKACNTLCVVAITHSPYDTFVRTIHRASWRALEGGSKVSRVLCHANDSKSLGCINVTRDSPPRLLWKAQKVTAQMAMCDLM